MKKFKIPLILIVVTMFIFYLMYMWEEPVDYMKQVQDLGYRIITAYNLVHWQTDNELCKGAWPYIDFCQTTQNIVATNELPLGSWIDIEGVKYLVADRTNPMVDYSKKTEF